MLALLTAALVPRAVRAQNIIGGPVILTTTSASCASNVQCATFPLPRVTALAFQISGTWSGTLTFQATADGSTYIDLFVASATTGSQSTTTTANGVFVVNNPGFQTVRVVATSLASGSATVVLTQGYGMARINPGGGSGQFDNLGIGAAPVAGNSLYIVNTTNEIGIRVKPTGTDAHQPMFVGQRSNNSVTTMIDEIGTFRTNLSLSISGAMSATLNADGSINTRSSGVSGLSDMLDVVGDTTYGIVSKGSSVPGQLYTGLDQNGNTVWNVGPLGIETITETALASTSTDGHILQNTTAATGGATVQMSPRYKLCGTAWNSVGAASETDCWVMENLPATQAGATISTLKFGSSIAGGAYTYPATVSSAGVLTAAASMVVPQTGNYGFTSTGFLTGVASGQFTFRNATATTGVCLDVATDNQIFFGQRTACTTGAQISSATAKFTGAQITTTSPPTGVTITDAGSVRDEVVKITVDRTAYVCAAVTCDVTIATLPANTRLRTVDANLGTTFACSATCTTSTLSLQLGKGAGGTEYLASIDADAATGWFGDADAELGTLMTRAAAIQGGTFTTGSQAVVLRLTSGTGFVGNGSATNLSQGSIVVYMKTTTFP